MPRDDDWARGLEFSIKDDGANSKKYKFKNAAEGPGNEVISLH